MYSKIGYLSKWNDILEEITSSHYKYGFTTNIESDNIPIGLNEDTVRFISTTKKESEWMLDWRLNAFRTWQKMEEPKWRIIH